MGLWQVQPASFWEMDLEEWWWLYEAKQQRDGQKTETDYAELYELIK